MLGSRREVVEMCPIVFLNLCFSVFGLEGSGKESETPTPKKAAEYDNGIFTVSS